MLKSKLTRISLVALVVVLMLSVFSMAVFADETADKVADVTNAEEDASTETEEAAAETQKAETTGSSSTTETEKEGFKLTTNDIISLVILGVAVIATAIYCIVKREKVVKFFRSLKSEFKKIVWSPWNQVRKNTLVVLVVVISVAVVIGVLDLIFNNAIIALGRLF